MRHANRTKTTIEDLNRRVLQYDCNILQTYNAFCKFINDVFCRLCLLRLEFYVQKKSNSEND